MALNVYLFGDQTYDFSTRLRELLHSNNDPLLVAFFEKSYHALRHEIGTLPQYQRARYERFASYTDLLEFRLAGELHPSLDSALLCVFQLAMFISECGKNGGQYPNGSDTYLVGLCTGALSAAAVSSCKTVQELVPVAVHTVLVAFKTGICVFELGKSVQGEGNNQKAPWSMVVSGDAAKNASEIIKKFSDKKSLPISSRPYMSAISESNVTISGPPNVLSDLRQSDDVKNSNVIKIPIYAPFHAPHLYTKYQVETILEKTSKKAWSNYESTIPYVSPSSGKVIEAGDYRSLLESALEDVLMNPLQWDNVTQGIASITKSTGSKKVVIHPISTTAEPALKNALKKAGDGKGGDTPTEELSFSNGFLSQGLPTTPSEDDHTTEPSHTPESSADRPKIAIIGMSGRFPDAEGPSEFWDLLKQGLDVHKTVPPLHWDAKTHVDTTGKKKNTSATPYGCWLSQPAAFDAKFFNMSPREAPQVDPAQRLALLTAYEAIEQAGLVAETSPSTQKDRVGVFFGVTSNDWMETNSAQAIDTYFIPGGNRAFIPGRINYCFKFSGPSAAIDTACSSSLAGIHIACNSLWQRDIDCAIAGGTNVLTNPDFTSGLDRGHFLSRTGNCKTFDDGADGYCRGEGVGTVILKRLDDAIADKDPIQGVILGAYTNHSAEAESITRPHVGAQRAIFKHVLNSVGLDPYDVSYVEMHGTGTQAGDAGEMSSVLDTFAPGDSHRRRRDDQKLYLGSAKANIGHGEAASGVTSLAKVLMMMRKDAIPPHAGIKTKINHKFPTDLEDRKVFIAKEQTEWKRPENGVRRVFVNNFSAAGGNSAILIEDAPVEKEIKSTDPRSNHIVVIGAKSAASMAGNLENLAAYIDATTHDDNTLPQLSYTTTARRSHYAHRVLLKGSNMEEIRKQLQSAIDNKEGSSRIKAASPKVAFTFTGQGSQYPGMGKEFYQNFSTFRSHIRKFDHIAQSQGFPSIEELFTADGGDISEYPPLVVQIATTSLQMALTRLWGSWGITPYAVVGHSLGEYAALNAAGVLSDAETIYLVGKRAELLQENCDKGTHAMLAVKAKEDDIKPYMKEFNVEVACINGPEDVVLSGKNEEVEGIAETLGNKKIKTTTLKVPYAFHSSQVDPILEEFEKIAQGATYNTPKIPVVCPLNGDVINEAGTIGASYLATHCRQAVNMNGALEAAKEAGVMTEAMNFIEMGPQPVVSGMVKATLGGKATTITSLQRKGDAWQTLTDSLSTLYLAGNEIHWTEYHRDFEACQRVLALPFYTWDCKDYWMQYVNDWSLRKGDPLPTVEELKAMREEEGENVKDDSKSKESKGSDEKESKKEKSKEISIESTTCHSIHKEEIDGDKGKITIEADIGRKDLHPIVQGHKVNGVPLCTPSVYADMAFSMGRYLLEKYKPDMKNKMVDVGDMEIDAALIAQPKGPQLLHCAGNVDFKEQQVKLEFNSVDENRKTTTQHARAVIRFKDYPKQDALKPQADETKKAMSELEKGVQSDRTFKFNKSMVYKMVATLADFDKNYQAINFIMMDSDSLEAQGTCDFSSVKKGGDFTVHPAYIDALSQIGGFVMNANNDTDLSQHIYVNHGWRSFQIYEELDAEKTYTTYCKMAQGENQIWSGDVLIFYGEKVVAKFGKVELQGVPRRLMDMMLTRQSGQGQKGGASKGGQSKEAAPKKEEAAPKKEESAPKKEESAPKKEESAPKKKEKKTKKVTKTVKKPKSGGSGGSGDSETIKKALDIIAEESGVEMEDLTDSAAFSDLGIDSLMTMIIAGRYGEEIGVEMEGSQFSDLPTVGDLKGFLGGSGGGDGGEEEEEEVEEEVEVTDDEEADDEASEESAPEEEEAEEAKPAKKEEPVEEEKPKAEEKKSEEAPKEAESKDSGSGGGGGDENFGKALDIVSEESGAEMDDLIDDAVLNDLGIDSLLTMIIANRFSEELGIAIDTNEMFTDVETIGDMKNKLFGGGGASEERRQSSDSSSANDGESSAPTTPAESDGEEEKPSKEEAQSKKSTSESKTEPAKENKQVPIRPASSIKLQGKPKEAEQTLFLFPDGAGSAHSYTGIPKINEKRLVVYGLNCPYLKNADEMKHVKVEDLVGSYIKEIRKKQSSGPYNLGGWSAGGILAYRATKQLISEGEEVRSLLLIDSPVPTNGLGRLPQRFYDALKNVNLFGSGMPGAEDSKESKKQPPEWLIPHFEGTIDVLEHYYPEPLPEGYTPKTTIIWAGDCVFDGVNVPKLEPHPDDTEDMKFLTEQRTNFGPDGWEYLFPDQEPTVKVAEGAHHFAMLKGDHAKKVAEFMDEATK